MVQKPHPLRRLILFRCDATQYKHAATNISFINHSHNKLTRHKDEQPQKPTSSSPPQQPPKNKTHILVIPQQRSLFTIISPCPDPLNGARVAHFAFRWPRNTSRRNCQDGDVFPVLRIERQNNYEHNREVTGHLKRYEQYVTFYCKIMLSSIL